MRRIYPLVITAFIVFAGRPALGSQSRLLVGRWRSDTAPTGYWIIERFADGRFAEKRYLSLDFDPSKPAEIVMDWGQWKLRDNKYSETLAGSTSKFFQKFLIGKRSALKVFQVSSEHFTFETHDGATREEQRQSGEQQILDVKIDIPPNAGARRAIDTITPALSTIPAWVKATTTSIESNRTLQPMRKARG